MFRNAVCSEMELLALVATKANIMILLNGFIVSALMISGAFIFSSSPEFLIPASTFMITAAASIVFALLSASPERIGKMQAARTWFKDFVRGRSKLRDLKPRLSSAETRFFGGSQPNILIYEDRVKLQKDQYWEMMQEIMGDCKQIYEKMSDHLYWLGLLADTRKGNRSPDRKHLMRFKIQDGNVLGLTSYDNLTQVLETDHKLHDLIRERTKAEVSFEEINIEGMAFDPVKKRLVLGFRDPEFNNMALVAFISNPKDVFERNAKPEFDEVAVIDIDGGGIRSLNYDPVLKTYVIANEVKDENG